jgi:hypothetical protein
MRAFDWLPELYNFLPLAAALQMVVFAFTDDRDWLAGALFCVVLTPVYALCAIADRLRRTTVILLGRERRDPGADL